MKINLKLNLLIKQIVPYALIILVFITGFFVGYYHHTIEQHINNVSNSNKIRNTSDVIISTDNFNNLIIHDINRNEHTIYDDSIGITIFNLYANELWIKHKLD